MPDERVQISITEEAWEVALVRKAARTFAHARPQPQEAKALNPDLTHALFHRQFLVTHARSFPAAAASPLLDALLCAFVEGISVAERTHEPAMLQLRLCLAEETCSLREGGRSENTIWSDFIGALMQDWAYASFWRMEQTMWSPMPWSTMSKRMGIPPPDASFDRFAPRITIPNDYDQDTGPGATAIPHDGYCRSATISAYVWIRLPTCARSRKEHVALFQSALTFGVLEAITGLSIPESQLLSRRSDGPLVLTSRRISEVVSYWLYHPHESGIIGDTAPKRASHAKSMVTWAQNAIEEELPEFRKQAAFGDTGLPPSDQLTDFCFSLTTLYECLKALVGRYPGAPSNTGIMMRVITSYLTTMAGKGWCPSICNQTGNSLSALAYAATLPPLQTGSPLAHSSCTSIRCVAQDLDTTAYKTQHCAPPVCPGPSCQFLPPSFSHVSEVLSSGRIPVVIFDGDALVVRDARDGPYIAISHVWADGLGSTTEVGLPTCQIARIATLARQLVPDGAFWIDSLCIPEGGVTNGQSLRKHAIRLMAETYRSADKVVVFDAGLRGLSPHTTPTKELVVRLATSSWMHRVWTLQEGMLARELYFEFSDGLTSVSRLDAMLRPPAELVETPIGTLPRDPFLHFHVPVSLRTLLDGQKARDITPAFGDIIMLLQGRTTSKPADETIAIAGLAGINVSRLLEEDDAEARMRAFYLEVKTLPDAILISNVPKMRCPGFRWAPRSLSMVEAVGGHRSYGMAQCTPQGLTTDERFTLIRLPRSVEVRLPDAKPKPVGIITNPATDLVWFLSNGSARGETLVMNGIVGPPGVVDHLKERNQKLVHVMAVYIPGNDGQSDEEPVVCEAVCSGTLEEVRSYKTSDDLYEHLARTLGECVVEGSSASVRITMT
ncbi:hypothetical protein C8Q76DRAFT_220459 [Earliella scabrosa]|nr:hypothetical protein C8Q76DRAFT_220459 [Earliella scabrosa]